MGSRNEQLRLNSIRYYDFDLHEDWSLSWYNLQVQSLSQKCCRPWNRVCRILNYCSINIWLTNSFDSRWSKYFSNLSCVHLDCSHINWWISCCWLYNHVGLRNRNLCTSSFGYHNNIVSHDWLDIRNHIQLQGSSKKRNWSKLTDICVRNRRSHCPRYSNFLDKR